jgi:hypothetical protein
MTQDPGRTAPRCLFLPGLPDFLLLAVRAGTLRAPVHLPHFPPILPGQPLCRALQAGDVGPGGTPYGWKSIRVYSLITAEQWNPKPSTTLPRLYPDMADDPESIYPEGPTALYLKPKSISECAADWS